MTQNNDLLISLLHTLNKLENDVIKAKAMVQKMFEETGAASPFQSIPEAVSQDHPAEDNDEGMQTVEGKFDGTFMVAGDGNGHAECDRDAGNLS